MADIRNKIALEGYSITRPLLFDKKKNKRRSFIAFQVNLDLEFLEDEVVKETSNICLMDKGQSSNSNLEKISPILKINFGIFFENCMMLIGCPK